MADILKLNVGQWCLKVAVKPQQIRKHVTEIYVHYSLKVNSLCGTVRIKTSSPVQFRM
jgi:hypothetical protein